MAAKAKAKFPDLDVLSADVAGRFDAVDWTRFNAASRRTQTVVRREVLQIRDDLMLVAAADPARAARIWDAHVPDFVPRPDELPQTQAELFPLNTIQPGRRRRKSVPLAPAAEPGPAVDEKPRQETAATPEVSPPPADVPLQVADPERSRRLLENLNRQYRKAGDKYHFRGRKGGVAFEIQAQKLSTQHDTPSVVTAMLDVAEAREWPAVRLTGSPAFRREAWLQASLRDLAVSGFRPTKRDRAYLAERHAERTGPAASNTIEVEAKESRLIAPDARFDPLREDGTAEPRVPLTGGQDQFLRLMEATMRHRGDAPAAIARASELANEKLTSERVHVGTLVELGSAPYQDRSGQKRSHFVVLQDDHGERSKVWGVDLPRALEASGAQPGEKVVVAFRGRAPVEVKVPVEDRDGRVVRSEWKTVDRNRWEVLRFDRLHDDAKAALAKAIERQTHPAEFKVFDRDAPPVPRWRLREAPRDRGPGREPVRGR